jgi:hypothetical protein
MHGAPVPTLMIKAESRWCQTQPAASPAFENEFFNIPRCCFKRILLLQHRHPAEDTVLF